MLRTTLWAILGLFAALNLATTGLALLVPRRRLPLLLMGAQLASDMLRQGREHYSPWPWRAFGLGLFCMGLGWAAPAIAGLPGVSAQPLLALEDSLDTIGITLIAAAFFIEWRQIVRWRRAARASQTQHDDTR